MNKIWFKAKRYGWGWTPVTWEGWFVIVLYIYSAVKWFLAIESSAASESSLLTAFLPRFLALTILVICISYLKGEKPKWRWGKER